MRIVIFSHYVTGTTDLIFGRKLAAMIREVYPDADIQLLTSSTSVLENKKNALAHLTNFNSDSIFPVIPADEYLKAQKKADIILLGPDLNIVASRLDEMVAKEIPILLFCNYDVPAHQTDNLSKELHLAGFTNVLSMMPGLGEGRAGIIIDRDAGEFFEKGRLDQVESMLQKELPISGETILQDQSPKEYLANTRSIVSCSQNNSERLLRVLKETISSDQNVDVILIGEVGNKEKIQTLLLQEPTLIEKGFIEVSYQAPGLGPEILLKQETSAQRPIYRVIHLEDLPPVEAINLRKLGRNFSGASGPESYSDAISTSSIIMYECQPWNNELVSGMQAIASKIDSSGMLSKAINLLASASTDYEYQELSKLINSEVMQQKFIDYRDYVLDNKDLSVQFKIVLSNLVRIAQLNEEKTSDAPISPLIQGLRNTLFGKGSPEQTGVIQSNDANIDDVQKPGGKPS